LLFVVIHVLCFRFTIILYNCFRSRQKVAPVNKNFLKRVIRSVNSSNKHISTTDSSRSTIYSKDSNTFAGETRNKSQTSDKHLVSESKRSENGSAKVLHKNGDVAATLNGHRRRRLNTPDSAMCTEIQCPKEKRSRLRMETHKSRRLPCREDESRFKGQDMYSVDDYVKLNEEYINRSESELESRVDRRTRKIR